MFTYFHCYHPETWEAQKECGLIDEHAGVRFMQTATLPEKLKINNLAAKGSPFYNMMLESRLPMYIDRLQGGVVFEDYKFDWRLVDCYREMLGDNFYAHVDKSSKISIADTLDKLNAGQEAKEDKMLEKVFEEKTLSETKKDPVKGPEKGLKKAKISTKVVPIKKQSLKKC